MLPIIIDCDPGVDDAIALLLAFASPELDILAITTVAGNVPLDQTQRNARRVCELGGRADIPVYAGCPRPLMQPLATAAEVHGQDGLAGLDLPAPLMPLQAQHGVDALIERIQSASAPVTIATLGPLTNLAVALIKAPHLKDRIAQVVAMGGAITHGNITPSAEFNLYVDPHAAHIVVTAGLNLTLIGLDVTHTAIATPDRLAALRAVGAPIGAAVATLLDRYSQHDMEQYGFAGAPLHDPCVIAYLLRPDLFKARTMAVQIETSSPAAMGRTIVDWWGTSGQRANVNVVYEIDGAGFYGLLTDRLQVLQDQRGR
jgi:purine nucleosidase